ncbi:MAG: 50S ribosomal protein L22 [Microgenomates group bacterium]
MIITATQKNTRQAPRKVRLVASAVKNMSLQDALKNLAVIERRSTIVVLKTLRQAIANAVNNYGHSPENLKLKNITVTEGPRFRRFRAVSRGRAHTIIKKTSHVTVELEVISNTAVSKKVDAPAEKASAVAAEKVEKKTTTKSVVKTVKGTAANSKKDVNTTKKKPVSKKASSKDKK